MKKYLPTLALAGCSIMVDDSQIPERKQKDCAEELQRMEQACLQGDLVGRNENAELYSALREVKACLGDVKVWCQDPGGLNPRVLTYEYE